MACEASPAEESLSDTFPQCFKTFLEKNNVPTQCYLDAHKVPRYFRTCPRKQVTLQELNSQLKSKCKPILWLPSYYALDPNIKIADTEAYKSGKIYGIDLASGAAVAALGLQPGEHVLDLCCAPGAKLCAIADALSLTGSVTGVDISESRLAACRKMCLKYGITNARLFVTDGTCFNESPPALASTSIVERTFLRRNKRRRNRGLSQPDALFFRGSSLQNTALRADDSSSVDGVDNTTKAAPNLYDKVLVDAECTHDGSIKHLAKYARGEWEGGWDTFEKRFLDPKRIESLAELQFSLLRTGFKLLRPVVQPACRRGQALAPGSVAALLLQPRAGNSH